MEGKDKENFESDDSDNEDELEAFASTLENQICENIFSYQSHVDLINTLKHLADLDRLRIARDRMAKQFPLTSELWLDWLEDEIKIASTVEEKQIIFELFKRAVKDYLSIKIWVKYLKFAIDFFGNENCASIAEVRSIFEESLTSGGLHVTEGSNLWHLYIDYEISVCKRLKNDDERLNQLKIIANLYKRCLSCPLIDIEDNFQKFTSWLGEQSESSQSMLIDQNMVKNIYIKSREKMSKIKVYEDALISDSDHAVDHYKDYLEYEKSKDGSPVRVKFLYERMICEFCLFEEVWIDYFNFVSTILNNGTFAIEVIQRALRNCPWSCRLHQCFLNSLEKYERNHEDITAAFEQAVASGLQTVEDFKDIWMSYLEYLRRRFDEPNISKNEEEKRLEELRENFAKAFEFLNQLEGADPEFDVAQFWARVEAIYCKNMEKSRSLWNEILLHEHKKTWEMWLEYISIERAYGDSKHQRKLYVRALQNTSDFPEKIAKCWLNYERDEGTLESYENCLEKIKKRLVEIKAGREREEAKRLAESESIQEFTNKKSKRAGLGYKKQNLLPDNSINDIKKVMKRKTDEVEMNDSPPKKSKKEEDVDLVKKLLDESQKGHGVTVAHDSSKDDRTVFVSNLDFSTEESAIRNEFTSCGRITDLRLVKDYRGRSKGYCYVEFEKANEASSALKKDRELLNGRPMFVSKCDPDRETRGKGFKYSSAMEKNKLFVRGLPYTVTEKDLRDLFGKYGALKDVRLVTYRNGHSKGLAYVEFEDEVSAAQAIIKTDGLTFGDREISVAISNPPDRKSELVNKSVLSLGGGPKNFGPRGRGRTQISFVPRSVKINPQSPATPSLDKLTIMSPQLSGESKKLNTSDFQINST